MKRKVLSFLMAAVLAAGSLVPFADVVSAEERIKPEVEEKNEIQTDGEALSDNTAERPMIDSLIGNLDKYLPDGFTGSEVPEAGKESMEITGITPIMPSEGEVETMLVLAEFSDAKFTDDFKKDLREMLYLPDSDENAEKYLRMYPYESLTAYYQRASFEKLTITGDVYNFSSEHERSYYDNRGDSMYSDVLDHIKKEIIAKNTDDTGMTDLEFLDDYISKYDSNNDMKLDGLYIAVAGGNNDWGNKWWSYSEEGLKLNIGSYSVPVLVQVVDIYNEEAGKENMGSFIKTFIHETGHMLGLDDYYSYEDAQEECEDFIVEKFDTFAMMNDAVGDQDGFAKMLLGWLPEESVQIASKGESVKTLRSYSETGDVLIIIPQEEYETYGTYSQFILAEHYTNSLNDTLPEKYEYDSEDNVTGTKKAPEDAFRFYHIYARKNEFGDGFAASNTADLKIPLISGYLCPDDEDYGFYRKGSSLTPETLPATTFYEDITEDSLSETVKLRESGISIKDITDPAEDGTMSLSVSFAETGTEDCPSIKEAEYNYDKYQGDYIKITYDRTVNLNVDKAGEIYDWDKETNTYDRDENWGEIREIRRGLNKGYNKDDKVFYFLFDENVYRNMPGALVIPEGIVVSKDGAASKQEVVTFDETAKLENELSFSLPGKLYNEEIEVSIEGAPEDSKIYYTLDGSEPNTSSEVCSGPIKISENTVLKAIALNEDGEALTPRHKESYYIEYVKFERESVTLDVGEKFILLSEDKEDSGCTSKYESSDLSIVYVDDDGSVLAKKEGTAVVTATTENGAKDTVTVTVKKDVALKTITALKNKYKRSSGTFMRTLSEDLNGWMTLEEFGDEENGLLDKCWCVQLDDNIYTGKALKPSPKIYNGISVLTEGSDYTLIYKNNVKPGEGSVTPKFKGELKQVKLDPLKFKIEKAELGYNVILLDAGFIDNGKVKKPKQILYMKETGAKIPFNKKNFDLQYYTKDDEPIGSITEAGKYKMVVTAKEGSYFTGSATAEIRVQNTDLVEKLKVKKINKTLYLESGGICYPEYGKDFKITVPEGYDPVEDENGELKEIDVEVLNNLSPGKMVVVLRGKEDSVYGGSQVITFTLKKAK